MEKLTFKLGLLFFALHNMCIIATDPFVNIQYSQAFNQEDIYKQYRPLMEKLGCAENVFESDADAESITRNTNSSTQDTTELDQLLADITSKIRSIERSFDPVADAKEFEAFQAVCLNRLNNARRLTLGTPTFGALHDIAFQGLISYAIMKYFEDKLSLGGMNFVYTAAGGVATAIKSGYNLMFWPDNSLEYLEDHFAKNKCFIPRSLWPKITKAFMAAREDERSRDRYTHFIDFALGFTVYKPKPPMIFKHGMSVQDVKKELNRRIEDFFNDYKDKPDINYIKINVSKFIDSLVHTSLSAVDQAPRYLYLYGSGGIGKTHFVQTLSNWIDELIPGSVRFEDVIINSSTDLEGSYDQPGAMLKVLRNQLLQNKRGSVLMMDEATWLNNPGMVGAAKRIFNGDRSKLITSYFGSNMDGSGVNLELPPMLIFVASNDPIEDPALASRFDTIFYPAPSDEALTEYAMRIAEKSNVLKDANFVVHKDEFAQGIQTLQPKNRNFRYVAGNVEAFALANKK